MHLWCDDYTEDTMRFLALRYKHIQIRFTNIYKYIQIRYYVFLNTFNFGKEHAKLRAGAGYRNKESFCFPVNKLWLSNQILLKLVQLIQNVEFHVMLCKCCNFSVVHLRDITKKFAN